MVHEQTEYLEQNFHLISNHLPINHMPSLNFDLVKKIADSVLHKLKPHLYIILFFDQCVYV